MTDFEAGAAFRRPVAAQDRQLIGAFETWVGTLPPETPAAGAPAAIASLLARGAELRRPDAVAPALASIAGHPDEKRIASALDAYVHFQLANSPTPEGWADPHELVERRLADLAPAPLALEALMMAQIESSVLPDDQRLAALARTRVVSSVGDGSLGIPALEESWRRAVAGSGASGALSADAAGSLVALFIADLVQNGLSDAALIRLFPGLGDARPGFEGEIALLAEAGLVVDGEVPAGVRGAVANGVAVGAGLRD
ncbi:hypothetical protein [Microbacterium indicum]|uniref:hypothetical protein n=1 Tax=Microbacterium indicum TaxID=358100 RepID=UPI0003F69FAB|nr:hypothetical protein [Microbacterium indicum]